MPQLMPLPWGLSCFFILFLIFMMKSLYSKLMFNLNTKIFEGNNESLLWFW